MGFGPPVDNGFYYDFDFGDEKVSVEDFKKIEKSMYKIINRNRSSAFFTTTLMNRSEC